MTYLLGAFIWWLVNRLHPCGINVPPEWLEFDQILDEEGAWREKAADVMGVPWTATIREVCEAIPPAYTEHIGGYLMAEVQARLAA